MQHSEGFSKGNRSSRTDLSGTRSPSGGKVYRVRGLADVFQPCLNLPVESWHDVDDGIGLGAGKKPDVLHHVGWELGNRWSISKGQVVTSQGIDGIEGCPANHSMITVA